MKSIIDFVKLLLQALLIAFVVRTFLFQPFNIPSGSLIPSLLVGDYLFVSKYAYGYSRYSFPFGPDIFSGRIWSALPKRGDIAVFKYPKDNSTDYIKRVIGLPGETVQMKGGHLFVNGKKAQLSLVSDDGGVEIYEETLPGGVKHLIQTMRKPPEPGDADAPAPAPPPPCSMHDGQAIDPNNTDLCKVPPQTAFMMGDNRDDSSDSRFWGPAPLANLEGRAEIVFFSMKTIPGVRNEQNEPAVEPIWQFWRWPWTVRWDRLFKRVR